MSTVTKIFVVLLVICSLLLSAAVVVFVNRVDISMAGIKKTQADLTAARAQANSLQNRMAEQDTATRNQVNDLQSQKKSLEDRLIAMQAEVVKATAAKAQAEKDLQVAQAAGAGATAVANAAQTELAGQIKLAADLRAKADDFIKQNTELNTELTVKSNENRALARQLEFTQERVAELTQQMRNAPKTGGTSEATPTPPAPIAGKVTSVDIIGGKKYATVNVGSAENVQKGMRFNVVNLQSGEFLGYLTIDKVEPNEAIGPVDGTKIDKIQNGAEVRTQL